MVVRIVNKSNNPLPCYAKPGDSGMDIRAFIDNPITLGPLERYTFPTGIYLDIPVGYEIQIRPRSGLTSKKGLVAQLGTIDSCYTGELGIVLINLSNETYTISSGERIAQIVCAKVETIKLEEVEEINKITERGGNGFGHSGLQ